MSKYFDNSNKVILARIQSLEQQSKALKIILVVLLVVIVGCRPTTIDAQNLDSSFQSIDALELKQLVFKDDNQNVRLKIDVTDSSDIRQSFFDEKGVERAQISIDDEGSARFRLFDSASNIRFSAVTFSDENLEAANRATVAVLGMDNNNNAEGGGVFLSTAADGSVSNSMFGKDGVLHIGSIIQTDGLAASEMFDNNKIVRTQQIVNPNGDVGYILMDAAGVQRQSLNVVNDSDNVANHLLFDEEGRTRAANFTTASGSGQYNFDIDGNEKIAVNISDDKNFSYYVEKTAGEQALDILDGALRAISIGRIITGN